MDRLDYVENTTASLSFLSFPSVKISIQQFGFFFPRHFTFLCCYILLVRLHVRNSHFAISRSSLLMLLLLLLLMLFSFFLLLPLFPLSLTSATKAEGALRRS